MKNFWKIVMLTVLCVSLLCGVTAMAEADRFQFEKKIGPSLKAIRWNCRSSGRAIARRTVN